jgi:methylated-DNA-[protein]-cysteine S-methyltransferase
MATGLPKTPSKLSLFTAQVYSVAMAIPRGKVTTYGEVAKALGRPGAARAVGNALRRNPYAPIVPCHRIVRQDLSLGGFSGETNPSSDLVCKKFSLLIEEGVSMAVIHST